MFRTRSQIPLTELLNLDLVLFSISNTVDCVPRPFKERVQSLKRSPGCILCKFKSANTPYGTSKSQRGTYWHSKVNVNQGYQANDPEEDEGTPFLTRGE